MHYTPAYEESHDPQQNIQGAINEALMENPGFVNLHDNAHIPECVDVLGKIPSQCTHMVVLGIGGSALGLRSVLSALYKDRFIHILDTLDRDHFIQTINRLRLSDTLVCVVSKSGTTLETNAQLGYLEKAMKEQDILYPGKQIVCITEEKSSLWQYAQKMGHHKLPVPKDVGGRFSVLTPVGLFPMLYAGVQITPLLEGASEAYMQGQETLSAMVADMYTAYRKENRNILVLMTYQTKLQTLQDWFRQLLAESIGKNPNTGITPTLALGSTDQHSQIQLYNEGPQDKLIWFLDAPFPDNQNDTFELPGNKQKLSIQQTHKALYKGTKQGLDAHARPFASYAMDATDEKNLGAYFMMHMLTVISLSKLLYVNPYDQPGVEEGKKAAKNLLGL